MQSVLFKKQAKLMKCGASRDRLKACVGHIWPAGRMLCMPVLDQDIIALSQTWLPKSLVQSGIFFHCIFIAVIGNHENDVRMFS